MSSDELVALIEARDHVCYRYRLAALSRDFAAAGWEIEPLVLAGGVLPFCRQMRRVAQADAVVLQRRLLPWWKLRQLRSAARRLVFDVDDAVFLRDSNSRRSPQSFSRWRRFRNTVRAADLVTAGNHWLAAQALLCVGESQSERIFHAPTVVDPAHYPTACHVRVDESAQLVWIGSHSTMPSLAEAQPALAAAAQRVGPLSLKIICDGAPTIPAVRVVACPWSEATEARELADADIGISWLPQHPWSAGKCGLKVLQYMAAGLPVVANPVALHNTLVAHGVTGFLASTPDEWAAAIARLAQSPALRQRMGGAARSLVERQYSTTAWGPKLAATITAAHEVATRCAA